MPNEVTVNLASGGSKFEDSTVTIGDITGGNHISLNEVQAIRAELQDVKLRLSQIEGSIEGNLGMPGISTQLLAVEQSMVRIEKELSLLNNEKYLVSKNIFYAVLGLLILMVAFYLFMK